MNSWLDLKKQNNEQMLKIMNTLQPDEQLILQQVIQFEVENRHIKSPSYKDKLARIVQTSVKSE